MKKAAIKRVVIGEGRFSWWSNYDTKQVSSILVEGPMKIRGLKNKRVRLIAEILPK